MLEVNFLLELLKSVGFPAIIFIVWYIYHKAQVEFFMNILKEQAEREERNFKLLNDMVETIQYHTAILSRVEQKIDSNDFCPIIKEQRK
jgi:hypothetical protein